MKPIIASVSEKYKLKLYNTKKLSLELNVKISTTNDIKIEKYDEINIVQQYIIKLEEQIIKEKDTMEVVAGKIDKETELCEELISKLRHQPSPNMSSLRNELHSVKAQ